MSAHVTDGDDVAGGHSEAEALAALKGPQELSGLEALALQVDSTPVDGDGQPTLLLRMPIPFPKLPNNQLVAFYRVRTKRERKAIDKRAKERHGGGRSEPKTHEEAVDIFADLLATTCVYIKTLKGGEYEDLTTADGDLVAFDADLASALRLDLVKDSAAGVLKAAFADNDIAIADQGVRYQKWAANPTSDADPFGVG